MLSNLIDFLQIPSEIILFEAVKLTALLRLHVKNRVSAFANSDVS